VNFKQSIVKRMVPDVHRMAPGFNSSFVHQTVHRAIHGVGPLPPAAAAAEKQREEQDGDVDKAISELIENHASMAAAQGFVANIGGIATAAAMIPLNITGLALLQVRMVAAIAHLRGYDLANPRVRNALLLTILGPDTIKGLVKAKKIPGTPMVVATAPAYDPDLDQIIAAEVTSAIVGRVVGKRAAGTVLRRVPLAGGVWGGSADAYATWIVGRYAARELRPRPVVAGTVTSGGPTSAGTADQLRPRSTR
jgi:uncharacterized protein (DUF697 family)